MLRRRHLGRISFVEANDFQRALLSADDDYVLLFEHPPTYTRGIRTLDEHFLVPVESLDAVVIDADRGGDVTYHAPGQVVAWAIVTVPDEPSAGKAHVTRLEDAVIATVRGLDPEGRLGVVARLEGYPGVWADVERHPAKIAAVGVRTERNARGRRRTLHGVALNVDIDLSGFAAIVPCGIPDKPVASLHSLGLSVSAFDVEERLGLELERRLGSGSRVASTSCTRYSSTGAAMCTASTARRAPKICSLLNRGGTSAGAPKACSARRRTRRRIARSAVASG